MVKLGNYVKGDGEIPAGTDPHVVYPIITAGDLPVKVQVGHQYGGDSGEYTRLILLSPQFTAKQLSNELVEAGNGTLMFSGNIEGGYTAADPLPLAGTYTRQQMGWSFILPPNYAIGFFTTTANTAAYYATLSGFECEY